MSTIAELLAAVPAEASLVQICASTAERLEEESEYVESFYLATDADKTIARRDALLRVAYEALKELHEAEEAIFPAYEEGRAAQDAWAQRKSLAHFYAEQVLAAINPLAAGTAREAGNG